MKQHLLLFPQRFKRIVQQRIDHKGFTEKMNFMTVARKYLLVWLVLLWLLPVLAQDDDPLPLYALPANNIPVVTSSSMVYVGERVAIANMLTNSVGIIEPKAGLLEAEVAVGAEPRSIALAQDGERVVVANRGDGSVTVIDTETWSVIANYPVGGLPTSVIARGTLAYVALHSTSEIVALDITTGAITARIPTPAFPTGLALWGDFLYVTHFWSGELSLIYLPAAQVVRTVATGAQVGLSATLELDPRGGVVYLPQTVLNANMPDVPYDARALPVVNVVELSSLRVLRERRIDLKIVDRAVSLPYVVRLNNDRTRLYIANAGSNDISVIDLATGKGAGFFSVGFNPRALLFSRDNRAVYIQDAVDATLSVANVQFLNVDDAFPTTTQIIPPTTFIGAQLFYSASDPRMSTSSALNCAVCHFDGMADGRNWDGFNTPALLDFDSQTPPYSWIGTWTDMSALEQHIQQVQAGTGLQAGTLDFDALVGYLGRFAAPASPFPADTPDAQRGALVFAELQCNACHTGVSGSDGLTYDVGTGGRFVTPPLTALWLSAPYFHQGSAPDLRAVLTSGQGIHHLPASVSDADLNALIAYLLSRN